ncbi:hypothetical protein DWG18_11815 [Lysobacter sp. TY2-98]|uniref:hypothetical protein n=1 Tax=Lysobacter sp. TY2-98 TaxID=2290922 RepID=UPI000E20589B|nr:hypothetical protein [Lysobacter sp. TY2-98]AXK72894.1 hypothetical protein DWG18_11815 [Lysobacter sp. TY2-98]
MRSIALAVLSCCLLASTSTAQAAQTVDARLDARHVKFEKDKDGDYRVVYNYAKEGRTQLVFVGGSTEDVGGFTVREVFSPAGNIDDDPIDGAMALKLLDNSRSAKLGAWELSGKTLVYVIKLPDDVSAAELEAAMDIAATQADDMEIKLSGDRDNY